MILGLKGLNTMVQFKISRARKKKREKHQSLPEKQDIIFPYSRITKKQLVSKQEPKHLGWIFGLQLDSRSSFTRLTIDKMDR